MKKIIMVVILIALCTSCSDAKEFNVDDLGTTIELVSETEMEKIYNINVTNNNEAIVKCIDVGMGFRYKSKEISTDSMFDAVFNGLNKFPDMPINIAKGETVKFEAHIPVGIIKDGALDYDEPIIWVTGFYDKLDDEHQFTMYGSLASISNNEMPEGE